MDAEHVDVLIVGAGLSGIGAACRLQQRCPGKTFAILEARDAIGGTWDLFRFPGIRSDSDMFTLGYPFRPWTGSQAIVDGASILDYMRETAREHGDRPRTSASTTAWWRPRGRPSRRAGRSRSSAATPARRVHLTCGFLFTCTGYYRYDEGYTPDFPGAERFGGEIVHPQYWPDDVDYDGKRVVVIGSGATAVTLMPALAERAATSRCSSARPATSSRCPPTTRSPACSGACCRRGCAYPIVRWKNVLLTIAIYRLSRRRPSRDEVAAPQAARAAAAAPASTSTRTSRPATTRGTSACASCPTAICSRRSAAAAPRSSPTRSRRSPRPGIALASGDELEADLIVTATGLKLVPFGGVRLDRRRQRRRAGRGARLPRDADQRRAEHGLRVRLHEPVVDARVRPHLRAGLPPAPATWTATATRSARRATAIPRSPPCRSPISPPATCCARSTSSPSRARATRGGASRTTRSTSATMRRAPIDDPALEFAGPARRRSSPPET